LNRSYRQVRAYSTVISTDFLDCASMVITDVSWQYVVRWLIVHVVTMWDRLVQDLLTGIGTLSGRGAPLSPTTDTASPTPTPAQPDLLPPAPPRVPYFPDGVPPHPPYIPESQMDPTITGGLDGVHGTGEYPMPVVQPPEQLGPRGYDEVAPGVWMPDPDAGPSGQTGAASTSGEGSGHAADAAEALEQSLQRQRAAVQEAGHALDHNLREAHHESSSTSEHLNRIHEEIRLGVAALQPTLNTPAGQAEMAQFLSVKTAEARKVIQAAQRIDTRLATSIGGLASRLDAK
jgi:Domain of unknown function (DUF4226)